MEYKVYQDDAYNLFDNEEGPGRLARYVLAGVPVAGVAGPDQQPVEGVHCIEPDGHEYYLTKDHFAEQFTQVTGSAAEDILVDRFGYKRPEPEYPGQRPSTTPDAGL